jgi:hypothetical protein
MVPRKNKKNHPRHALLMFHDAVSSPVLPNYFVRESVNLVGKELKNLEIVDPSKWLHFYPDPWDPIRVSLVKNASMSNYWYTFLCNIFHDGKLFHWGNGSSNVLSFLVTSDILKLMRIGIDLVAIVNYNFFFPFLPCLWKTPLEKDRLQVLVDAIEKKSHLVPKAHRFLYLLFSSRCENPLCMVKENTFNREMGKKWLLITEIRSTQSIFFASKFLLGLCPEFLDKQVSKSLLATAARTRRSSEAHVLLFQMSDHQEGILVNNRYALTKPWKDMLGHHVGGKLDYCLIRCDTPTYIT